VVESCKNNIIFLKPVNSKNYGSTDMLARLDASLGYTLFPVSILYDFGIEKYFLDLTSI